MTHMSVNVNFNKTKKLFNLHTRQQHLLLSTKQEHYIIGRLQQIQNFSKIPLFEMLYVVVDAEQNKKKPSFFPGLPCP